LQGTSDEMVKGQKYQQTIIHDRSILITGRRGYRIYASADIDTTGEYNDIMKEWTVNVLARDHASSCPLESLENLEVRIGDKYHSSFHANRDQVVVRVYNVECNRDQKSFSLTLGSEMVILGRVQNWPEDPEQRSPGESDRYDDDGNDGEVLHASLDTLLQCLQQRSLNRVELIFNCIVFKETVLGSPKEAAAKEAANWETFE